MSMINEANKILTHAEAQALIAASWRKVHLTARVELGLPSGKIADVVAQARNGDIYIAEVKTELKASLIEAAAEKYWRWCNFLFFAVPAINAGDINNRVPVHGFAQNWHRVGIVGVYPATILCLRPPSYHHVMRNDAAAITRALKASVDW